MKKIFIVLLALTLLTGCTTSEYTDYEDEPSTYLFELDLPYNLNKLSYSASSRWQLMSTRLTSDLTSGYDKWSYYQVNDYDCYYLFTYRATDNAHYITEETYDDDCATLTNSFKENQIPYNILSNVKLGDYLGIVYDVTFNGITTRCFYTMDDTGVYAVSLNNGADTLPADMLEFTYNYYQTFSFNN